LVFLDLHLALGVPLAHFVENIGGLLRHGSVTENPLVVLNFVSLDAVSGICHKKLLNEVFGFLRHGIPLGRSDIVLALLDFLEKLKVVIIVEGRLS
jgi:hypothetical protein